MVLAEAPQYHSPAHTSLTTGLTTHTLTIALNLTTGLIISAHFTIALNLTTGLIIHTLTIALNLHYCDYLMVLVEALYYNHTTALPGA